MKLSKLSWLAVLIAACNNVESPPPISAGAQYLKDVLDIMEKNSINRKTIDWPAFREGAQAKAENATTIEDVYPAIASAIKALGDHHSFYQKGTYTFGGFDFVCTGSSTVPARIDNIGYVKITGFSGSQQQANDFAASIQSSIKSQDKADLKGWIVDLRGNNGGNMWPMVSGIGPILGEGTAGYFIDPDGVEVAWGYTGGSSVTAGGAPQHSVTDPYTVLKANQKVAVLLDQRTASSGEAVAVSFIGRANTRSFGLSTCGLSTSNSNFKLSDGAFLYLTTGWMADRNKGKKGGPIVPDVTVAVDYEIVAKAVEWLNE